MPATKNVTVTSDNWELLSDGLSNVLVGHESVWPMHIFRGTAAPTADDGYRALSADQPYAMSGIPGQKIYARCGQPGRSMVLTVDAV